MTKTEFKEKIQVENLICVHDGKVEKNMQKPMKCMMKREIG